MNKACVLGWMSPSMERVGGLALALASWALAESLHSNGFIAAFVAGMTFGAVAREHAHHIHEFLEAEGEMLMVLVFLMFGASLLWPALSTATTAIWIYAVLSLVDPHGSRFPCSCGKWLVAVDHGFRRVVWAARVGNRALWFARGV